MAILKVTKKDTLQEYKDLIASTGSISGTVYFVRETGQIFLWNDPFRDYSGNINVYSGVRPSDPEVGQWYYNIDTETMEAFVNGGWVSTGANSGAPIDEEMLEDLVTEAVSDVLSGMTIGEWETITSSI